MSIYLSSLFGKHSPIPLHPVRKKEEEPQIATPELIGPSPVTSFEDPISAMAQKVERSVKNPDLFEKEEEPDITSFEGLPVEVSVVEIPQTVEIDAAENLPRATTFEDLPDEIVAYKIAEWLDFPDLASLAITSSKNRRCVQMTWDFLARKLFFYPKKPESAEKMKKMLIIFRDILSKSQDQKTEKSDIIIRLQRIKKEIMEPDILKVANRIAEIVGKQFTSIIEFRSWLKNPNNQEQIQRIRFLDLASLGLRHLPEELSQLRNLRILQIHGNEQLECAAPGLENLPFLENCPQNINTLRFLKDNE